jgi:hypothetical protein
MLKNIFQLDLRSLALARFCLGVVAFFDIGRRLWDVEHFFTDAGLLPRSVLIENFELSWRTSLLYLNGSYTYALLLLTGGMLASLFYTFGWRTRISNLIVWLVIISFQARFPEGATSGGDMLLRIFLFWSLFLPMNARFSFDRAIIGPEIKSNEYLSIFSGMWVVQVFLLYFFTFLYKWAPVYHTTFEAVWYMLQLDIFTTPVGKWMGQQFELTRILSFASYSLEIIGPLLLIIPWRRDLFRGAAVLSFWLFHLGIALTLHLGNFVPICLIIWVGLIPTTWWNFLEAWARDTTTEAKTLVFDAHSEFARQLSLALKEMLFLNVNCVPSKSMAPHKLMRLDGHENHLVGELLETSRLALVRKLGNFLKSEMGISLSEVTETGEIGTGGLSSSTNPSSNILSVTKMLFSTLGFGKVRPILSQFERWFGAFLLTLIVAWNIEGYVDTKKWSIGSPFDEVMFSLHLQQGWAMFAPHPQRSDGWWVMDGTLKNGKKWDTLNEKNVTFDRPEDIYATFPSEEWRKFLDNLQGTRDETYLQLLAKHLCRTWNKHNSDGNELSSFQLYFMREFTQDPHEPPAKVEKVKLWNHSCF